MPDKGGESMKNKQICPWCGELLNDISEDYDLEIGKVSELNSSRTRLSDYDRLSMCNKCKKPIYNTKLAIWKPISTTTIIFSFIAVSISYLLMLKSDISNAIAAFISILTCFVCYMLDVILFKFIVLKNNHNCQKYSYASDENKTVGAKSIYIAKITFSSSTPAKQLEKEFVKDNILQISANGESEYIILTKADFETGKCEATFPAMKKENGLALLEKYSEFELSNGEEILGWLKVEKVFDA